MKLKHYILPLTLAVCANTAMSEDYGWYHHPQQLVGPFISPEQLCASFGASVASMDPIGLITWGSIPSSGQCGEPTGGLNFFRLGDSCPAGKVYDNKQMSCESPEPDPKNEDCTGGILDITGQCNPQGDPGRPKNNDNNSCGGSGETASDTKGNPVFIATGQKVEIVTDLEIPNSALNFTRNYWSSRLDTDTIGLAWQHNWQMHIKELQSRDRIKLYRDNGRGIIFTPRNGRWESDSKDTEVVTKLANNQGWKVQTATGEIELYNNLGQLISYEKQGIPRVTLTYNTNQQLITVKDSKGHSLSLTYNTKNLITSVTASNGSSISYNYDSQNRLISFIKDGNTQTYHYENTKRTQLLTGITDERGIRYATWTYNDNGQAISSEHAGGAEKYTFEYLPNNQTRVTNPLGKSALYTFQDIRLEKKIKRIEGQAINSCIATNRSFNYNAKGLVVSENTKNNATIYYEYNDRGLQTKRKFDGSVLRYESTTKWHDTLPLPIEINNNGQRQSFQYDSNGRLIEYTNGFKDHSEINKGQDVALLQFNDFTDETGNIWQTVGNPQIVEDPDAVTGKALYLDSNSYLKLSNKSAYDFGTGDFTIEAWVKPEKRNDNFAYLLVDGMYRYGNGSSFTTYIVPSGDLYWLAYQSGQNSQSYIKATGNLFDGDWHHIAYSRKEGIMRIFIDGKLKVSATDKNSYILDEKVVVAIGSRIAEQDGSEKYKGYLDQIRISKDGIYTENFLVNRDRLVLNNHEIKNNKGQDIAVLQFNNFTDEAENIWTINGNSKIVNDKNAITGQALYLDADSYLELKDKAPFDFGPDDFTIEAWVKPDQKDDKLASLVVDGMYRYGNGSSFTTYINKDGVYWLAYQSRTASQSYITTKASVFDGNWHHIAYSRKQGIMRIFVDGILKGSASDKNNYVLDDKVVIAIGKRIAEQADSEKYIGYLDQIRISKRAIYTQDFTPSREPYVLNQGVMNP